MSVTIANDEPTLRHFKTVLRPPTNEDWERRVISSHVSGYAERGAADD